MKLTERCTSAREAVAKALVKSSGTDNTATVVAAIRLSVGVGKIADKIVNAALGGTDSTVKNTASTAAGDPTKTLGNLAPVVVATVRGGQEPPLPPDGKKYEGQ